jgi:hypothetical protein
VGLEYYYYWYRPSISRSGNRGFLYLIQPLDSHYHWGGTSSPPPQLSACADSSIWSRDGTWVMVGAGWQTGESGGSSNSSSNLLYWYCM